MVLTNINIMSQKIETYEIDIGIETYEIDIENETYAKSSI